jgi:hypothetical protein
MHLNNRIKHHLLFCFLTAPVGLLPLSYADDAISQGNTLPASTAIQSDQSEHGSISWSDDRTKSGQRQLEKHELVDDRTTPTASEQPPRIEMGGKNQGSWIEWSEPGQSDTRLPHDKDKFQSPDQQTSDDTTKKSLVIKDGIYIEWHKNGRKKTQGNYKNGKKDGLWIYWDATGRKISEEHYIRGDLKGRS